jgi:hypothetical protein
MMLERERHLLAFLACECLWELEYFSSRKAKQLRQLINDIPHGADYLRAFDESENEQSAQAE